MARRALLTDRERELIAADLDPGDDEKSQQYQAISRVRNKIDDELTHDVALLSEHNSELLEELRDVVCNDPEPLPDSPANEHGGSPNSTPRVDVSETTTQQPDVGERDTPTAEHPDPARVDIGEVLDEWRPGQGLDERAELQSIGRTVLRWLRDRDEPASRSEFVDALYADTRRLNQGEDSWWRRAAREALQEAQDAGVVEYEHGRHEYRWVGRGDEDT